MSFFDSIKALFGIKSQKPVDAGTAYLNGVGQSNGSRPLSKQVYAGRGAEIPDWAEGLNNTDLVEALKPHVVCRYAPNFGMKKIMSTVVGPDGNLVPEYEGIGGDCGAIKNFGMKIAKRDGLLMPYRYFDLDLALKACCDNPKKCPFFQSAEGDAAEINSKLRKI